MEKPMDPGSNESSRPAEMIPTGGVPLDQERLRHLAPQWETVFRSLRRMDEIPLGETEPLNLFVWKEERP